MSGGFWCERAWLGPGAGVREAVLVAVEDGRIGSVQEGVAAAAVPTGTTRLAGLVLPGLADAHSHAFHRALRGRAEAVTGTGSASFWTWREQMYALADRLDPDTCHALAAAAYSELVLAGVTTVGEFHYLHHGPGGVPYDDPNAMGHALVAAAREAGLRITLLDACYLAGGMGEPLRGAQRRFGDGDAEGWAGRVDALADAYAGADDVVVAAAVHSVRAVPADQLPVVTAWAEHRSAPLHVHLSEQPAENDACLVAYGRTPAALLHGAGVLGPRATAVHATHVDDHDIDLLGESTTTVCLCPATERELADGIGPGRRLADAGCALAVGTDSHAVVDLFEQVRAVETHERLTTGRRGHFGPDALLGMATAAGHGCLGRPDAGLLTPGARADLVAVSLGSTRTAGTGTGVESAVWAASAADVTDVVVGGRPVVVAGAHRAGPIGPALAAVIDPLWEPG